MHRKHWWIGIFFLGVTAWSIQACKKEPTLGAVAHPMEVPQPVFDTLVPSDAFYYWEGKIGGKYVTFEDEEYALWDTNNTYINIAEEGDVGFCENDSIHFFYEFTSRFLRPGIPNWRMEINLFDCVKPDDDIFDTNFLVTPTSVMQTAVGAWPFTDEVFRRRGAQVVFTDSLDNEWKTDPGSGQLIDTYFRITDVYLNPDTLDTFSIWVAEGEFAGRLYNGASELFVQESTFRLRFRP